MEANQNAVTAGAFGPNYLPQLVPQGFFGSLLGGPVGGLIGGGIGGLFGNSSVGRQIGQTLGTVGGGFLPFSVDPVTAAYAQQAQLAQLAQQQAQLAQQQQQQPFGGTQQLAPQGFFGNLLGQIGQPLGSAIGGVFGNAGLGGQIGGIAGSLGRFLPFNVDPMTYAQAYGQQQAFPPQAFAPQVPYGQQQTFAPQLPYGQQQAFGSQFPYGPLPAYGQQMSPPYGINPGVVGQFGRSPGNGTLQ